MKIRLPESDPVLPDQPEQEAGPSAVTVMQRVEMKYRMNPGQTAFLLRRIRDHMEADSYGKTTISTLYYDTPSRQLIRTSLDRPVFKEKIRLRSYGPAAEESPVFLELKRKAYGVVFKRRIVTTLPTARAFFAGQTDLLSLGQIGREITAFRERYGELEPSCLILSDRTAFREPDGDLRLTIDENPRYRMDGLSLTGSPEGIPLLADGWTILEIKVQRAVPLWMARILSDGGLAKDSFSKYGEAYTRELRKARAV